MDVEAVGIVKLSDVGMWRSAAADPLAPWSKRRQDGGGKPPSCISAASVLVLLRTDILTVIVVIAAVVVAVVAIGAIRRGCAHCGSTVAPTRSIIAATITRAACYRTAGATGDRATCYRM
jgi:hypothetical protein